jgi:putative NADPH-quinone reductase
MKNLVVFHSHTGNTKMIAESIADRIGADIEEIVPQRKRTGFILYFLGGAMASSRTPEKIREPKNNPADYEHVIICSPVWAWSITPAVRGYINAVKDRLPETSHVMCSGGDLKEKSYRRFAQTAGEPKALLHITMGDIKSGNYRDKLEGFFQKLESEDQST